MDKKEHALEHLESLKRMIIAGAEIEHKEHGRIEGRYRFNIEISFDNEVQERAKKLKKYL